MIEELNKNNSKLTTDLQNLQKPKEDKSMIGAACAILLLIILCLCIAHKSTKMRMSQLNKPIKRKQAIKIESVLIRGNAIDKPQQNVTNVVPVGKLKSVIMTE